jgi:hypothetical protein
MMKKVAIKLTGDELNERLDAQMLLIERIAILLEDAKLDVNDELALDGETMAKLMELISDYDAFLKLFRDTTEDTVATVKRLTTVPGNKCCSPEEDGDLDADIDVDMDEDVGE